MLPVSPSAQQVGQQSPRNIAGNDVVWGLLTRPAALAEHSLGDPRHGLVRVNVAEHPEAGAWWVLLVVAVPPLPRWVAPPRLVRCSQDRQVSVQPQAISLSAKHPSRDPAVLHCLTCVGILLEFKWWF